MGLCRCLINLAALWTVLFLVITFMPGLPPPGSFEVLNLESPKSDGPLIPNTALDGAKRILENKVFGPEGLASRGPNELFISTVGGHIMKLSGKDMDKLEKVVTMGTPCEKYWEESVCGRPLGIRFSKDGKLLVSDGYLGVWKVDVDTGEKKRLFDHRMLINGSAAKLVNDAIEDSEGNVYWSVSSCLGDMTMFMMEGLAGPSGRLLKYDPKTGKHTVLMDRMAVSNGVELSPKEDFILVSETWKRRVLRYWLKGPKKGTHEVFIGDLPGKPDNVRIRPDGYDIPVVDVADPQQTDVTVVMDRLPWLRKLLARLVVGFKRIMDSVTAYTNIDCTAKFAYDVLTSTAPLQSMTGTRAMVVQVDVDGKIVSKLAGDSGTLLLISQTEYVGDDVYFATCCLNHLGVISKAELQKRLKETAVGAKTGQKKDEL